MIAASYQYPERLPFDATLVVGIVLVSTLAQEIRSLSRKVYPLEPCNTPGVCVATGPVAGCVLQLCCDHWRVIDSCIYLF